MNLNYNFISELSEEKSFGNIGSRVFYWCSFIRRSCCSRLAAVWFM